MPQSILPVVGHGDAHCTARSPDFSIKIKLEEVAAALGVERGPTRHQHFALPLSDVISKPRINCELQRAAN